MTGQDPHHLTLDQAADRLGVHYMTVYRYVRLGQLPGRQENGRWWIESSAVDALADRSRRSTPVKGELRWNVLRQRLLGRLDDGDAGGAWSVFESAFRAGRSPVELYVQLLGPVLREVGEEWAAGERSIDSEHRASATALRLAGRIGPRGAHPGRRRRATVLLGGAAGDPHQLPLLMVADVLRWEGFRVVDLGADVPIESFVDAATAATDLVAVGVSLSVERHGRAVIRLFKQLRLALPEVLLLAGGPALADEESALSLGADNWAPDAGGVAAVVLAGR
jgi:MerR family transcriptional regulator, light-induced transcriptional regulator